MMDNSPSILSQCTSGGCGAKIASGALSEILENLPKTYSKNLLVGYDSADDAAVYQMDAENSIISTVDFFSPMVENPRTFGRIAATNALSDVYAMGGTPIVALNLVCFPEKLPVEILGEILAGGVEKVAEAGAVIGGGHSIYDREPKYGLAVTGKIATNKIIRNNTPQVGDALLLTKALGVGIIMAADRVNLASEEAHTAAIHSMERLNRSAAESMKEYPVHACTDVTGFGLLSHLSEMCGTTVSAEIDTSKLPVLPMALEYADDFLLTAAGQRNRMAFGEEDLISTLPFAIQELLFDPQTSGGLVISVKEEEAQHLLSTIQKEDPVARIIGRIIPKETHCVVFK